MRAIACCGILITHVAFQTGADTGSLINRMMARTDFFVPVFFALSGFLLWRRHRGDFSIQDATFRRPILTYYIKRIGRIMPAVWVLLVIVLLLFPVASTPHAPSVVQILANFAMGQVYVSGGLLGGLTHLWSLSVEVAFYLVLPLVALAIGRFPRKVRVAVILAVAVLSLGWAYVPTFAHAPGPGELNPHVMPPAFIPWFAVGLLSAEAEGALLDGHRLADRVRSALTRYRLLFWLLALAALVVAANDGAQGLQHASPGEFSRRVVYGTVFAAALIAPYALAPSSTWLESAPMQALGRWSYSIFLWHMSILSLVFPLLGIPLFHGGTAVVLVFTFLLTVPVAAMSYAVVEEPARKWTSAWWRSVQADHQERQRELDRLKREEARWHERPLGSRTQ